MKYSKEEVLQYMREEDVKFIRLAFCDVFGRQKNISIMPQELPRAFEYGIAIDASAITGFGDESHSDLFLHPDTDTLTALPWRPEHGRVVRMFCSITGLDGKIFECDTRSLLRSRNFICSGWTTTERPPRSPMTTRPIWISPPKTRARIYAARSALCWTRWGSCRKARTMRRGLGRMRSTSAILTL